MGNGKNMKMIKVKFIIGDVRDKRLSRALDGIDYVIHAAATKIVLPQNIILLCIKTNINGAMNVIDCSINSNVKRVVVFQR